MLKFKYWAHFKRENSYACADVDGNMLAGIVNFKSVLINKFRLFSSPLANKSIFRTHPSPDPFAHARKDSPDLPLLWWYNTKKSVLKPNTHKYRKIDKMTQTSACIHCIYSFHPLSLKKVNIVIFIKNYCRR